MSAELLFSKVRMALESAGIPYMVTGSFASSVHGIPRATNDIDIVIDPTAAQLVALMRHFPESEYYADLEDALEAFRHGTSFNVIDQNTIWKIDFMFKRERPFSLSEFDRRTRIEVFGIPVFAATPEDLLIAKLEWAEKGESERQLRDAAGIIAIQGTALDHAYIEKWVKALGLEKEWLAAQSQR